MKETIEKLREKCNKFAAGNLTFMDMVLTVARFQILTMERIDAMEHGKVQLEVIDHKIADIERAAMIKALRWSNKWSGGKEGPNPECMCEMCMALRRLENGGYL